MTFEEYRKMFTFVPTRVRKQRAEDAIMLDLIESGITQQGLENLERVVSTPLSDAETTRIRDEVQKIFNSLENITPSA